MGAEYDHIGIDEASRFTKFQFDNFKTNLRSVRDDLKLQMYLGSNPGGVGHGWLKRLFMDKEYEAGEDPKDYKFIPAKVYDNTILMKKQPDYVKELETLPPDLKQAFLEGDWDVFAGQALRWKRDKHVISRFPYPIEDCKKIIGFDWGYNDHGAAVFLAKTPDGHIFQYREIYQNRRTPEEWAEDLKLAMQVTPVDYVLLPHDCFSKQQGRDSIAEVFKRKGVGSIRRADSLSKGARVNGLALFHMYLSEAPDGIPYFQVHESCVNTIRSLPELIYDESRPEDVDCFVKGTKIDTPNGRVNVENINVSDLVCTPIGNQQVIKAGLSGDSHQVVKVTLSNGETLEGTANHKVFVKGVGLKELQQLQVSDILMGKNNIKWLRQIKKLFTTELNTLKEKGELITSLMDHIKNKVTHHYIVKYILTTMEESLKDFKYIIKTTTTTIMNYPIWLPYQLSNMPFTTTKLIFPHLKEKRNNINGITQKKVKKNFPKTLQRCSRILQKENFRAEIVSLLLQLNTLQSFIAISAESLKDFIKPFVPSVIRSFYRRRMVQELPKPVHITAVGPLEEKRVYKLTVEKAHLYYANGILTTNTEGEDHLYDAIRISFLEWGKPRGKGGVVSPASPESVRRAPTVMGGRVPALDVKRLFKKIRGRSWKYN